MAHTFYKKQAGSARKQQLACYDLFAFSFNS
jgi:hypothetical protein